MNVYFTPIGLMNSHDQLYGDYHIVTGSPAIGAGTTAIPGIPTAESNLLTGIGPPPGLVLTDYDAQARVAPYDIGADQHNAVEKWFPF